MNCLGLMLVAILVTGCAVDRHVEEILFADGKVQKYAYYDETYGKKDPRDSEPVLFLEALDTLKRSGDAGLPELKDLPLPARKKTSKVPGRAYTGLIRNLTNEDISFPSGNSDATLVVPARGTLEYITWKTTFQLIGYCRGKPAFARKITVEPRKYAFMNKSYDFLAEITPEKPPVKKRLLKKRRPAPKAEPGKPPEAGGNVA